MDPRLPEARTGSDVFIQRLKQRSSALWQRPQKATLMQPVVSYHGVVLDHTMVFFHSKDKKYFKWRGGLTERNTAPEPIYWRRVVCWANWCGNASFRAKLLLGAAWSKPVLVSVYHRHLWVTPAVLQIAHC